jgi:hypothetical protein
MWLRLTLLIVALSSVLDERDRYNQLERVIGFQP